MSKSGELKSSDEGRRCSDSGWCHPATEINSSPVANFEHSGVVLDSALLCLCPHDSHWYMLLVYYISSSFPRKVLTTKCCVGFWICIWCGWVHLLSVDESKSKMGDRLWSSWLDRYTIGSVKGYGDHQGHSSDQAIAGIIIWFGVEAEHLLDTNILYVELGLQMN